MRVSYNPSYILDANSSYTANNLIKSWQTSTQSSNTISASKAHDNDKQLCAATADIDEPSWWWIDLGYVQHIDKIRLFGRSDICENCLATNSMLTVRIGETLGYQNGATNTRCSDHACNIYKIYNRCQL